MLVYLLRIQAVKLVSHRCVVLVRFTWRQLMFQCSGLGFRKCLEDNSLATEFIVCRVVAFG